MKKGKVKEEESMLGKIIESDIEVFKSELVKQKINIGTMTNIKLNLVSTYNELERRKDAILVMISKGEVKSDDPEIKKTLEGLYAYMMKVEEKVLYLTSVISNLSKVD